MQVQASTYNRCKRRSMHTQVQVCTRTHHTTIHIHTHTHACSHTHTHTHTHTPLYTHSHTIHWSSWGNPVWLTGRSNQRTNQPFIDPKPQCVSTSRARRNQWIWGMHWSGLDYLVSVHKRHGRVTVIENRFPLFLSVVTDGLKLCCPDHSFKQFVLRLTLG